ncbi:MAG TPA: hypothetical protein VMO80_01465 [Terriglobales bacterium]|nr:hypothetical protein [Terriglobales bacterium]
MGSFSGGLFAFWTLFFFFAALSVAQGNSASPSAVPNIPPSGSTIALRASSTMNVVSEMGGAFMSPSKCDADGNLYIRKYAMDRPLLGPVVKIDPDGKRVALFDPAVFSQLALDRADAFSPASDGGMYQVAQSGVSKPRIYVLHFSSDGSPASPTLLEADFEVYTFAAFANGNYLVSGVKRDVQDRNDRGRNFTAVFSADGREVAQLSFPEADGTAKVRAKSNAGGRQNARKNAEKDPEKPAPTLDLADAEAGSDGNLYVMRGSSPALIYVIAATGTIVQALKIAAPVPGGVPSAFHLSGNRLAISFWNEEKQSQTVIIADAQTGRKIGSYADATGVGTSFACYSANDGVFTFLKLGEGNALEVIRAEAQ